MLIATVMSRMLECDGNSDGDGYVNSNDDGNVDCYDDDDCYGGGYANGGDGGVLLC